MSLDHASLSWNEKTNVKSRCDDGVKKISNLDDGVWGQVTDGGLEVVRIAPKRPCAKLPFAVWMALAKAVPMEQGEPGVERL